MKTTKDKQDKKRRAILRSAVELITKRGFEGTTMKAIARAADVGDATIYKYFPSKEKLLIGYYESVIDDVLHHIGGLPELEQYTLQERLQLLVDGVLEALLKDREFVDITRAIVGKSPLLMMREAVPGQQMLKQHVAALLKAAEDKGEIAPCDFKDTLAGFFADYLFAVIVYWLNDESEEFANTTQLVELTLSVLVLTLESGVVHKLSELIGFLVRSQLSRMMHNSSGLIDMLGMARRAMRC